MRNKTSKFFISIIYPGLFVIVLWGVKLFEFADNTDLSWYGLYPRTMHGLLGILTAPLLHANFSHLLSNTLPLLILGSIIFFFYRAIAFQVFFWVYLMTGLWVWAAARDAYHIGASGLIYGFVTFLFFSGIFRRDTRLMALSLFVVFLYGGTVWGIFPIQPGISWESHMLGSLAGLITAFYFRNEGPVSHKYDFGNEEEDDPIDTVDPESIENTDDPGSDISVNYNFIPKGKEEEK